jgi:hypothetical protein
MSNILEIQVAQKQTLYELLKIERLNKGIKIKGLEQWINRTKAGMTKEEIAYVKELIDAETESE